MRHIVHLILAIVILGGGLLAFFTLKGCEKKMFSKDDAVATKHQAGKKAPATMPARPMIRTRVAPLTKSDFTVTVLTQGNVRSLNETSLTPQVGGRVKTISKQFEDGAFFAMGDVLLELDNADYLTEIESSNAHLARAQATHAQEQARAKQALLNWKDAGFDEEPSDLVLRKPQLREAEANVNSARANLARAKRNLDRTRIRAPYNGRVRSRKVGLGQQVGPGTTLGEIFATDAAEVRLPLTPRDLSYYKPPNKPGDQAQNKPRPVTFTSILAQQSGQKTPATWKGEIIRTEGVLDSDSRQIFVIARILDPFGLKSKQPALYLGQPVRASITAEVIKDTYTIPREALSDLNQIIVVREGKIVHVDFTPVWSTSNALIVSSGKDSGILPGDQLATTRMPFAPEGAPVEIMTDPPEAEQKDKPQPGDSRRVGRKGPRKSSTK